MQFLGHFPQQSVMPGVLIVEAMAQTGAVYLLKEEENRGKIPLFAGINKMRFSSVVVPGDVLRMKVQFKRMIGGICIAGCEAYVDDKKSHMVKFSVLYRMWNKCGSVVIL